MGNEKTPTIIRKNEIILSLYDTYFSTLLGFAIHLTRDEIRGEELVADIFAKICKWDITRLEKIATWNAPSTYRYLSNTLANKHTDLLRKENNRKRIEKNYVEKIGLRFQHSPESTYLSNENVKIIKKAYYDTLATQPKTTRIAFYLRTERGWKNKEIANRMNTSPNTIGTNFRRLRAKIKERIS